MNKRQRKTREKRRASGFQAAQDKSYRVLIDMISKRAQELADEALRRQYSIFG